MVIKKLDIKGFGNLKNKTIELSKGINVIYGDNEAGKTTIAYFIKSILLDNKDIYEKFIPWDNNDIYCGGIELEYNNREFLIYRDFCKEHRFIKAIEISNNKEIDAIKFLKNMLNGISYLGYDYMIGISKNKLYNKTFTDVIKEYLMYITSLSNTEIDTSSAIEYLNNIYNKVKPEKTKEILTNLENKINSEKFNFEEKENNTNFEVEEMKKRLKYCEYSLKDYHKKVYDARKKNSSTRILRKSALFSSITAICMSIVIILCSMFTLNGYEIFIIEAISILLGTLLSFIVCKFLAKSNKKNIIKDIKIIEQLENEISSLKKYIKEISGSMEQAGSLNNEERLREYELKLWEYEENYRQVQAKLKDEEKELQSISIAATAIEEVSRKLKNNISIRIDKRLKDIIYYITEGKCQDIVIDEDMSIRVKQGETYKDIDSLSEGTLEQVYLALLMSGAEILFKEKRLPLILDDTFAFYDDKRVASMLEWISKYINRQVIIFTCRKREKNILVKKNIIHNYIEL